MPNSTTGIMPAPTPVPHHEVPPQPTITLHLDDIRQVEGLYCLNDLHKMAGGKDSDKPHRFLRLEKTQKLIQALEERLKMNRSPQMGFQQVFATIQGGAMQGSYGSRKLLIAYANWIDPYVYDMVLEVFDRVVTIGYNPEYQEATEAVNEAVRGINLADRCTTFAGRTLVTIGRYKKPILKKHLAELLSFQQYALPLVGGSNDN